MKLREAREKRGLTQGELAEQSGVDQTTISNLEISDDPNPTWRTVQRLASVLRMKPHELFPVEQA